MKRKNIIILILTAVCFLNLQAQTTGDEYLPKAGTVALGATANISNLFINTIPGSDPIAPTLCVKYYVLDRLAIRATVGVNTTNRLDKFNVRDDAAFVSDPLSNKELIDTKKTLKTYFNSAIAVQQFFGDSKLRGFVGIQGLYNNQSGSVSNSYANTMNTFNPSPSAMNGASTQRILEQQNASTYSVGGGLIAGFEYFVLPHLSIGGEISLNAIYSKTGQVSTKSETVVNDQVLTVDKVISSGGSVFNLQSLGYGHKDAANQLGIYIMYNF